jgi:uncharacterized protein YukE
MSVDNTRADGMSGKMIYDLMTSGPGTGSLTTGSTAAATLTSSYATIEDRLRSVSAKLGEGWTGASADAAQQAASPINKAVIEMQTALQSVDQSIDNQGVQFGNNKGALKPLPDAKPESGFWNDVTPWETDTDRAISSYNSNEAENRRLYTQYQGASTANRDQLPSSINGVTTDQLNVAVVDNSGSATPNSNSGNGKYTNSSSTSGWNGSTQQSSVPPPSSYTPPPAIGNGDGTTTTSGNTGNPGLPGHTFPGGPGQGGGPGGGLNNGGNTGYPGGFGMPGGPGGGGAGRSGGMPGGGRGAGGAGGMGGGRAGGGVGAGALGAGRTGESFGPGGKSGMLGGMGAAESAGRGAGGFGPGGAGAAGGRGAAGAAGGMGAGGAKGQGDEDGEHRSAAYLVNEDNGNEIVGDMPLTAPPVLGG